MKKNQQVGRFFLGVIGLLAFLFSMAAYAARTPMYLVTFLPEDYFYTVDPTQRDLAVSYGGLDAGIRFYVDSTQIPGTLPIQRFFIGAPYTEHFYTVSSAEANYVLGVGFVYERNEGFMYPAESPQPAGTVPLYRLFWIDYRTLNSLHYYTIDPNSLQSYINAGFLLDGVVGYVWPNASVTPTAYDAKAIAQTVPEFFEYGVLTPVSFTMQNTGAQPWTVGNFFLGTQNPQDNDFWCIGGPQGNQDHHRVPLLNDVPPGGIVTFTFTVLPGFCLSSPPRSTSIFMRMISPLPAAGTFGEQTPDPYSGWGKSSTFVPPLQAPSVIGTGQTAPVTVKMKNTGIATWTTAAGYRLGSVGPMNNFYWGINRVELPAPGIVRPGEEVTFAFNIVGPTTTGPLNFQWQMVHDGVRWMGDSTPPFSINVSNIPVGRGLLPPGSPPSFNIAPPRISACDFWPYISECYRKGFSGSPTPPPIEPLPPDASTGSLFGSHQ
jgi:hypothetical protein